MKGLSPEAQAVLQGLTEKQRRAIRKTYPFRPVRNRIIRQLRARGVSWHVIAEASGLSRSRVQQIGSIEDGSRNSVPSATSGALKEFKRAFEGLYKATLRLLKSKNLKGSKKGQKSEGSQKRTFFEEVKKSARSERASKKGVF